MKVAYVLDSLNRGGAEILALDVCRNAASHGLEMTLIATGGGTLEDDFKNSGVDFVRLTRKLPIDPIVVRNLRKILIERQIKVVHGYQAVETLHAYLATIGTNIKRVMSFHGHVPDAKNRLSLKILIPRMDANIIISQALKHSLKRDDGLDLEHNLHFIFNGVDESRLDRPDRDLRKEIGLNENSILLGMVANFYPAPRKDQLTVCRALPQFFRQIPNAHFLFVHAGGVSEDKNKLRDCMDVCDAAGISDRVHFLENRFPAIDVVRALDAFVLSSLHEGLPISVKEAMLLSKPCILSDIEPLIEISKGGKHAVIFKTGDADDLAEKMVGLIKDPGRMKKLGTSGRNWAAANFSISAHLDSLRTLYQELTAA